MKIVVIGSGYVGLVTGTCLADVGHHVVCVDVDEKKIQHLKNGKAPIYEPGLEELIKNNVEHERLSFTTKLAEALPGATVAFIAVGTPEGEDGSADLRYVKAAAAQIAESATGSLLVVVKSTVPVGTGDLVEKTIAEKLAGRSLNGKISVASNPEFLKEGAAIPDFMRPDRIVVGVKDPADAATFRDLYNTFVIDDPGKLFIVDRRSSELIKYGSNAMLATRISFMNEMAQLCEKVGADVDQVRRGMGADPRIGRKFLWAGPGYGGSCFPKDVEALLRTGQQYEVQLSILDSVTRANDRQKLHSSRKIIDHFKGQLAGKNIAIWGLAFKPGTDDVREAPAITIIQELLACGATVYAHDPQGMENFAKTFGANSKLIYVDSAYDALESADALVLLTEWSEYKRPNWQKVASTMRTKVIFDLRNQYSYAQLKEAGFAYRCIGRPDDAYNLAEMSKRSVRTLESHA